MPWFQRADSPRGEVNWKKNLAAIWISQFLSLSAFSFCLPFLPLHLIQNKIVPEESASSWASVLISVASISMMIFAPIWGTLGDRYGRKMMLVRANLAGGFVLYLMGVVGNIEALIVLRLLHGAFTGTTPAAQTLVTTSTPDRNQGFAMGLIMAAISAGNTAGNYFGGMCAKYFGPALSFKVGGVMLFVSTMLVVALVKENFSRPERLPAPSRSARLRRRRDSINSFKAGIPILLVIGFVSFLQSYDGPYLSLYVDYIHRMDQAALGNVIPAGHISEEVYGITGQISAVASIAAMAGSIVAGVVMDRRLPAWLWVVFVAVCSAGAAWVGTDDTLLSLAVGRGLFLFFISGFAAALIVVLGRMTPSSKRGAAMGWSMTTRSFGWSLSPLLGAYVARSIGWNPSYVVLAGLTLFLVPMLLYLLRRYSQAFHPEEGDKPSMNEVGGSQVSTPGGQGRMG